MEHLISGLSKVNIAIADALGPKYHQHMALGHQQLWYHNMANNSAAL